MLAGSDSPPSPGGFSPPGLAVRSPPYCGALRSSLPTAKAMSRCRAELPHVVVYVILNSGAINIGSNGGHRLAVAVVNRPGGIS